MTYPADALNRAVYFIQMSAITVRVDIKPSVMYVETISNSLLFPTRNNNGSSTMVNFFILAGGYTAYIASYLFDTDNNSLTYLHQYETGGNPSWIISHPTNKNIL